MSHSSRPGYVFEYMALTLEAYRNIVNHLGSRRDIATLCRVSKGFQYVCERALYNTLYFREIGDTIAICNTLAKQPRLSILVDALTINISDTDSDSDDDSVHDIEDDSPTIPLPDVYWPTVSSALQKAKRLRYLNIHINQNTDKAVAWILDGCTFRLRRFHCDLDWDFHLVKFLNTQVDLNDLYILDYNETCSVTITNNQPPSPFLNVNSLPNLATLECTFSEAAIAIVPGRPITHLKACFSRSDICEKREEMTLFFLKIKLSTRPLRSLHIADSTYSEVFSMELLSSIVSYKTTTSELRYIGTLVLPIMGKERLHFYGLLMRFPRVECIEVEISEWVPAPASPPAFRALASEMRLYTPSVTRVVFVNEFDRTVVNVIDGIYRVETDVNTDLLWREG
ncbi:hypothetical protein C0992_009740 [Termitomyces sp. T32_za158]|nr:hypothetical protein C0992_009740 [Termitomyces sp. T32_za158]